MPLYLPKERPVVERDGTLIMVDDDRMPLNEGEVPEMKKVRFRTLGCYPLTGAIESDADSLPEIIQEMLLATTSERQGRLIDHDQAGSMERKRKKAISDEPPRRSHRHGYRRISEATRRKELLRFLTCGSVDDGKSTLIGRLLYDSKLIFEDQLQAVESDSSKVGTVEDGLDLALLVDGLQAEREQGITIDVAYRIFLHVKTQVHHRRHTRPRAVHPQHGDRRIQL